MTTTERGRPRRILLVEDEAIIAMAERMQLEDAGYEVAIAGSGQAAVEAALRSPAPELVLMDIDLGPGIDGTQAAAAILAERRLPIVFLTSHASADMVRRVRGITRYGYVIKNSGGFVLLSTIEMAFELFEKERVLEERGEVIRRAEEVARLGYWCVQPGSRRFVFSEGARAILGLARESYGFEEYRDLILEEDAAARDKALLGLLEGGAPYDVTYRVLRPDRGEPRVMRSSGRIRDGRAFGVIQDVTDIERLLGELQASERRQAVTLRSIGDGVVSTDLQGRVVEMNPMAEKLTGWEGGEAAGRPIAEVFRIVNAHTREQVDNPIRKVLETGYVVGLANHTVLIARDGAERHIADSAAPIRAEGGAMLGVVLVFRDVTADYLEQERRLREAAFFKAVFEESHTPMLLVEPAGGAIRGANRAASAFYGWSPEELRRMNIGRINTLATEEVAGNMRRAMEEGRAEFRFSHRTAGGAERPVTVVSGPVTLDGETLLFSIVHDAAEAEGRERQIQAMRERAEVFFRDARHRMKNTVQMIDSLVSLEAAEAGDERVTRVLGNLRERIAGMALVFDYLYIKGDRELVDAREYLSALLRSMVDGFFPAGVSLREELAAEVLPAKFAVSLGLTAGELVTNACKYAFPGGVSGTITVHLGRGAGGALELRVRDDGVGIPPAGERRSGGEGLGLELIASLVELEGGELRFEAAGAGTSILCSFPKQIA